MKENRNQSVFDYIFASIKHLFVNLQKQYTRNRREHDSTEKADFLLPNLLKSNQINMMTKTHHLLNEQDTPRSENEVRISYILIIGVKRGKRVMLNFEKTLTVVRNSDTVHKDHITV